MMPTAFLLTIIDKPESFVCRLKKLVQRHRAVVAASVLVATSLTTGLIMTCTLPLR